MSDLTVRPGILAGAFELVLRNKRTLLWAYLANLLVGIFGAMPLASHLAPFLNHSMAAQRILGTFDIGYVVELFSTANQYPTGANTSAALLVLLYVAISTILAAGTYFVFISAETPRLGVITRSGVDYFWRFIRLALVLAVIAGIVLGLLGGLRSWYLNAADEHVVEAAYYLRSFTTLAVLVVLALFLRLWFDIAEALVVWNGMHGVRAIRKTIFPALRVLLQNMVRGFGSYLLAGFLGCLGMAILFWIWTLLPAHAVFLAMLVAQIGVAKIVSARVLQRAIATTLVMHGPLPGAPVFIEPLPTPLETAAHSEIVAPAEVEPLPPAEEPLSGHEIVRDDAGLPLTADVSDLRTAASEVRPVNPPPTEPER